MFWNLFINENTKNFRRQMLWIELGVLFLLVAGIHLMFYAILQLNLGGEAASAAGQEQLTSTLVWPGALANSLGLAGGNALGGLLLVVLVGAVTAQEYTWRTLHLVLSRGASRPVLLIARFGALLLPLLLFVLVTLLAGGLISAVFSLQFAGHLPFASVDWGQLGWGVLRTAYSLLPYAGLAFLLAVASRSVVLAVAGSLTYTLLVEGLLLQFSNMAGGAVANLARFLPGSLASGLNSLNTAIVQGSPTGLDAGQPFATLAPLPAALGIAIWTVLLVGLTLWIFQRQDLAD